MFKSGIYFVCFLFSIISCKSASALGETLEEVFPDAFRTSTGIHVTEVKIAGVDGYEVDSFPEKEKHRNHY